MVWVTLRGVISFIVVGIETSLALSNLKDFSLLFQGVASSPVFPLSTDDQMTIDFAIQNVSSVQKHVSAKVSCTPESSPETHAGLTKACLVNLSFIPVSDGIEESTTISEDDASPKQSVADEPTTGLPVVPHPSKMYYLFHRKVKTFYATLDNRSNLIHGQNLKEGEGRFLIKNTYCRGQAKWSGYKPEVHLQGTWIAWKMEETREHIPRERIAV